MADQNPISKEEKEKQEVLNAFLGMLNREEEEEQTLKRAQSQGMAYVNLVGYSLDSQTLSVIPEEFVRDYGLIAYAKSGKNIKVATLDPQNAVIRSALKTLEETTDHKFFITMVSRSSIRYGQKVYDLIVPRKTGEEVSLEEEISLKGEVKSLDELKGKIQGVPTTEIVDLILIGAVSAGASDIHLEPTQKELRIRYRIDGFLHDIALFPKEEIKPITSRIKFLAKLKLDITREPQDGKFFVKTKDKRIDIRVSSLPAASGENLVLRLFDKEAQSLVLEELGLIGNDYKKVEGSLQKSSGMVLVCGPTGSGKTTTLYAILDRLNKPGINIITLEDPIEYSLSGITQSQVDEGAGYDFQTGLRSILRQDPDIIMIGEIRDKDTAEMATHAALTGHIVLSTLHTNDAPGAIPRLIDLGVKPFLIVNAISLIIAQRLVRKICESCKEEYEPAPEIKEEIKKALSNLPGQTINSDHRLYRGKGCQKCHQTGYKGRIGIFEILPITEEINKLILKGASGSEIKKEALASGMKTMEQDGLLKAIQGMTSAEEVWRVVRE